MDALPRVVIVGGGFGGLAAAKALRGAPVEVVLIDRRNHHLFQPLLYQVATGALSPANIAVPLRRLLRRQENTRVLLAEVLDVDLDTREVVLGDRRVAYDFLVVAAGAENQWFGHHEWAEAAPGLKSIADATAIRARILRAFEQAELDPEHARDWLTFAVIGAGPTGVEMAGAIAELARDTLRHDFRTIDPTSARIVLIEGAGQVLPPYPARLGQWAERALQRLGVEVWTGAFVTSLDRDGVTVRRGDSEERLGTHTTIWAAGVVASPLGARIRDRAGLAPVSGGRVPVPGDLALADHSEVFVIGDMAAATDARGDLLPAVAPVAMQQGRYVAGAILDRLGGREPARFRYRDGGSMATIGRGKAVLHRGTVQVGGLIGWLGWLFVHLLQLAEFENRMLVLTQWAWSYLTRNRAARLIVEDSEGSARRDATDDA